jgi:hypothetical protein
MPEEVKTPEPLKLDPHVAHIAKSFGLILTEEERKVEPSVIPLPPSLTLAETVIKAQEDRKAAGGGGEKTKTQAEIDAENAADQKRKDDEAAAELKKAEDAKKAAATAATTTTTQPQTVIKVVKDEPPKKAEPTEAELKAQKDEEGYIASLTEDQREEIEVAKFHDAKNGTNLYKQHIEYFKKVDAFDPNISPDSDEFKKFTSENKPKWTPAQRWAAERAMIEENAKQQALEVARAEAEPMRIKVAKMEADPVIAKANEDLVKTLTIVDESEKDKPVIQKDVVEKILLMDSREAQAQYPVAAKIVLGTRNAIAAYVNVVNGVEQFNPQNGVHAWVATFLKREGAAMKQKPESETTVGGRKFLPIDEFARLAAEKPEEASKYWTFSQRDVIAKINKNGITQYRAEVESLRKEGFDVGKVSDPAKTESTQTTTTSSPRAGGKMIPGATTEQPTAGANANFFKALNVPPELMPK